ncbi:unnamed protein product [Caenorhabditis auriculariae]|uniref:Abnormal cell migration protein 18-like fibronectin type I domain-containing protein n=1 Tax=Caenorhabditis auriculariae TaxID=2777116 RepID=A0A8S1GYL7_9PELO|nr:unnamed protein product [Caenorhabditis auriculariae]
MLLLLSLAVAVLFVKANDYDIEVLPEKCDCRDWYGGCRLKDDKWTDDSVWIYTCEKTNRQEATFEGCGSHDGKVVSVNSNTTIDNLWHTCEINEVFQKFEIEPHCETKNGRKKVGELFREGTFQWLCLPTGLWVKGCYYKNENGETILIPVGEKRLNGVVEHVCSKKQEYPAIVQYYAQVQSGIDVVPGLGGTNRNLPEAASNLVNDAEAKRWIHDSADAFISSDKSRSFIRYLPASRKP